MKKTLLLSIILFLLIPLTKATHIIGGDISIQWVSQNNYRIKLRMYRDDVNAAQGAHMPDSIQIGIYDALTHSQVVTQTLHRISLGLVNLGDLCYTPDTNTLRIEEGIFMSAIDLFIPNNPNGYYLSSEITARNLLALNVQGGVTMTWMATMADPAIGQNSSPDFGNYPNDPYLCINTPKPNQFSINDSDGDSLSYSLVEPLTTWTGSNGTSPGSGVYPYYPPLTWNAGFSLSNIIGGTNPMTIDPTTGIIIGEPSIQGFYTFAVKVEEFRDTTLAQNGPKVKIGETRRDVQYQSLNCASNNNNASFNYTDNGNGNYSFTNTSTGSYTLSDWSFGDGNTSSTNSPNHTFVNNGTYVVVLAIADSSSLSGATCNMNYYIDTINVTGVTNPVVCKAGFSLYTAPTQTGVIVVNSATGSNLTYFWDFDDGNTSNQQFPSYTYSTAGPFNLCLTVDNGNGCIDTFCDSINSGGTVFKQSGFEINIIGPNLVTEIANTSLTSSTINIYPNPASDQITIANNNTNINKIETIDITGKTIQTITKNSNIIDVSNLVNGIYFLKIQTDDGIIYSRFVKE